MNTALYIGGANDSEQLSKEKPKEKCVWGEEVGVQI